MRIRLLLAAGWLAGAFIGPAAPTSAEPRAPDQISQPVAGLVEASAAKRKTPRRTASPRYGTQIACTQYGCGRVPPGCTPVPGRTWDGSPSGFDVIACPWR